MSEKKHNAKKDTTDGPAARIQKGMKECNDGCCKGTGYCDTGIIPKETEEAEGKN